MSHYREKGLLLRKQFTQPNIISVLRKVNLFNNVSIGFCKPKVVASNSLFPLYLRFIIVSNTELFWPVLTIS